MRITRTMTTDGPRQAVFNTAELLEQILLSLPAKKVFICQRVSRQFRDIVATSAAIQQHLFLRPSGMKKSTWITRSTAPAGPYSYWGRQYVYFEACDESEPESDIGPAKKYMPARLSPLLSIDQRAPFEQSAQRIFAMGGDRVVITFPMQLRESSFSWRETYLTDPPCTSVMVNLRWTFPRPKSEGTRSCQVNDPNGITLGAVIDAVLQEKGSFGYRTHGRWEWVPDSTVDDIIKALGETKRKRAVLERTYSSIELQGVVIPDENEWQAVK